LIQNRKWLKLSDGVVRVRSWEEFKRLAIDLKPPAVVYVLEQNVFSPTKDLTNLRLIMPCEKAYYVFLDFSIGEKLRETGIPISVDQKGNRYIKDEDVKSFLKTQIKIENLAIYSYWTA